jgi:hypothetical protein
MLFPDPKKPIAACGSNSCEGCSAKPNLHCHFRLRDWIHFLFISLPPFLLGGAGINNLSGWWLAPWIIFGAAYFGFIEIRVMCSHCPHYAETSTSLRCWANFGSPKLWKYRPGPMTKTEKVVFLGGFILVWGYPLPFLILGDQVFLLSAYLVAVGLFFLILTNFMCARCMNFACPLNRVRAGARERFFRKNPTLAEGWQRQGQAGPADPDPGEP